MADSDPGQVPQRDAPPDERERTMSETPGGDMDSTTAGAASGPPKSSESEKTRQLGDFKLIKKLGQGGMGEVFLATQMSLDRHVAIKTLSKEMAKREGTVKRFIREARSMAKLQHPNVVQVYAADSQQGIHFAAIEYIDGMSMEDWIEKLGRLSIGDALHVTLRCAEALKHAHDQKMIHRDIKPDNILITAKGVVKVADFGLAKAIDEDVSMTQSGTGLGTPLYMAPEQARNAKHVDQRTDIYALGCTLYCFVTGELPFMGSTMLELIMAKEKGVFKSARKLNREVPDRLDLMIDKMIAKEPASRYASCDELIRGLSQLGLDNAALEFIDHPDKVSVANTASVGGRTAASFDETRLKLPKPPTKATQSPPKKRKSASTAKGKVWYVQYRDSKGKVVIGKMSTEQIRRAIATGKLGKRARAKDDARASFQPLSEFREFEGTTKQRASESQTEKQKMSMKEMYASLDQEQRNRKKWRWLKNLRSEALGFVGFAFWLILVIAVFGGGLFALYKFLDN
ncbi:MAG: serine/threonine-protein kinase [Planctomycetaceae bacterium]